jgi:hypothetical protein
MSLTIKADWVTIDVMFLISAQKTNPIKAKIKSSDV